VALNRGWWLSVVIAVVVFGGLVWLLQGWSGFSRTAPALGSSFDSVPMLAKALTSPDAYVLPFEVASVLLLAALIGSVYIAFQRKGEE
jgi:NADH-quinone oxidoreductase subunit J